MMQKKKKKKKRNETKNKGSELQVKRVPVNHMHRLLARNFQIYDFFIGKSMAQVREKKTDSCFTDTLHILYHGKHVFSG